MKKFLACLLFIILFPGFAQSKNFKIGVLLDANYNKSDLLVDQLKRQVTAVVGEDADVQFPKDSILFNDYDLQKAGANYNALINRDLDLILAFGVVNNEVISKQNNYLKPTILFGAVNQDIFDFDVSSLSSGIKNYTYLVQTQSFTQDLSKFKQLVDFQNIGIVIDSNIKDLLPYDDTFSRISKQLNASYKLIVFDEISEIIDNLDGIDAVYFASGFFFTPEEVKRISNVLINQKLPSFTMFGVDQVASGFMATNQPSGDIDQFFRRIALTVESFIAGTPLSEMPVFIESTTQLTMNYNTAEAVGVSLKYSLIENTDFVGEIQNAISEKQYGLLEVIEQTIQQNQSLSISKLNVDLKLKALKSARNMYFPSLSVGLSGTQLDQDSAAIGGNSEYSTGGNLNISQTLFSETYNANIDINRHLYNAEIEILIARELDLVFEAINTYFNILILKSNAEIQLQNLKLTNENLKLAKLSFEVGQSGKSDVLRLTSEKAQNTQSMVEVANQLEQAYIALNQLMNNPINYEIEIEDVNLDGGVFKDYNYKFLAELLDDPKLTEPFIEFLIIKAKELAPELKSINHNILATERDYKLNGFRRFIPTVSLQSQHNRTFDRGGVGDTAPAGTEFLDKNHSLMLNFSIPLFDRNRYSTNRQIAEIQKEQLAINHSETERSIEANLRRGILQLINQMSNINLSRVSESSAKESLALTQVAYSNGAVNIVELLDAQNNYTNAQLSKNNAIYNFLVSSLQLERYVGRFFILNNREDNNRFKQSFYKYMQTYQANSESIPMGHK